MRFRRAPQSPKPEAPRPPAPWPTDDPARPSGWSPGDPIPAATFAGLPFPPAPVSFCAVTKEQEQRTDDLFLLRALVKHLAYEVTAYDETAEPLPDPLEEREVAGEEEQERDRATEELAAFSALLGDLEARRFGVLTKKRREWAIGVAERREIEWGDPGARNRAVPKGAHVELLVDTMRRPLAPPGRKPTELPGRKTA